MDIVINVAWTVVLAFLGIMSITNVGNVEFAIICAFFIWILWKDNVTAIRLRKSSDEEKHFNEKQAEIEAFREEYNKEKKDS